MENSLNTREVWLRGPLPEYSPFVQPVAHALLQAREELHTLMNGFDPVKLWAKPAGVASVGFHLQHLTGVLDRLFTYARAEALTSGQLQFLKAEGIASSISPDELIEAFDKQVDRALRQLLQTDEHVLTEVRGVGRAQLPSTVLGLFVHAAEHSMRHLGQLHVTVRVVMTNK
ncbi:DinB family protein [Arundinibacter roseus]|uniref:DinB family protein n=1 Tax=Arundinibacter roseus TaxID=2070510 RepID=A0A4V2XAA8_9BACT|nr:DinB family protein [Arundinibacter roseus]TDB66915.1 DinB family protein [Arundinibacter roseus]